MFVFTTNDNLYLLSGIELTGLDEYDTSASTTTQLEYYVGQEGEYYFLCGPNCSIVGKRYSGIIKQYNNSNTYYWLRSAVSNNNGPFACIGSIGSLTRDTADSSHGVAPAFRIG